MSLLPVNCSDQFILANMDHAFHYVTNGKKFISYISQATTAMHIDFSFRRFFHGFFLRVRVFVVVRESVCDSLESRERAGYAVERRNSTRWREQSGEEVGWRCREANESVSAVERRNSCV